MMRTMDGVVTIVQEGRFMLTDDTGAAHLFVLSPSAAAEPAQLRPLQQRRTRVQVHYTPAPQLIGHLARKIFTL